MPDYIKTPQIATFPFPVICTPQSVDELALPLTENRIDFEPLHDLAIKLFARDITSEDFMREVISILYRVGAVAVKPNSHERFYYSHLDPPVMDMALLGEESHIRIHPMLHKSLGIEPRRDPKRGDDSS